MAAEKKILVIDDDVTICHVLKLKLERTGRYEVIFAENGQEGVDKARSEAPDLIVLDIMMPGLHGGETAGILAEQKETRDIPVLFLSAMIQTEVSDASQGLTGGRRVVSKAAGLSEIVAKIEDAISETS